MQSRNNIFFAEKTQPTILQLNTESDYKLRLEVFHIH